MHSSNLQSVKTVTQVFGIKVHNQRRRKTIMNAIRLSLHSELELGIADMIIAGSIFFYYPVGLVSSLSSPTNWCRKLDQQQRTIQDIISRSQNPNTNRKINSVLAAHLPTEDTNGPQSASHIFNILKFWTGRKQLLCKQVLLFVSAIVFDIIQHFFVHSTCEKWGNSYFHFKWKTLREKYSILRFSIHLLCRETSAKISMQIEWKCQNENVSYLLAVKFRSFRWNVSLVFCGRPVYLRAFKI